MILVIKQQLRNLLHQTALKIKDVNDFQEADGLIKYFTIDDKKMQFLKQ